MEIISKSYLSLLFGNDPDFVAKTFKKYLENEFRNVFTEVIFAIPTFGKKSLNFEAFRKYFAEK